LGIIFAILVAAQLQGIYDILYSNVYSVLAIVANLFWNGLNIVVVFLALQVVDEKPEKRVYQRIKTDEELTLEDVLNHKFHTHIDDISRSGIKFVIDKDEDNIPADKNLKVDLEGSNEEIELLNCDETKDKYICKSIFKRPISMLNFNKIKIKRLNKYVRVAYKKPDLWDDYFEGK
jgi:hypothetical protein